MQFRKMHLENNIDIERMSEEEVVVASERSEKMETDNIELRLPSLHDVHAIKLSGTPLLTAKELFIE